MLKTISNSTGSAGLSIIRSGICSATLSRGIKTRAAIYEKFGPLEQTVEIRDYDLPRVGDNQVLVRMLAAPVNPSDFNMVEGTYGLKASKFPAVVGNEGAGVVVEVGAHVSGVSVNDRVITNINGLDKIPAEYSATLAINPASAMRMLSDYVNLRPGDVVIQNCAASTVGQATIQIAKAWGLRTINIIEDGENKDKIEKHLKDLGADVVVTESFAHSKEMRDAIASLPKPRLGMNAIGGLCAGDVAKLLSPHSVMVTYGGMSKQPLMIPTRSFIFEDLTLKGFWMMNWYNAKSKIQHKSMFDELSKLIEDGKLKFSFELHKFSDFEKAIRRSQEPHRDSKVVLKMDD